ncbi:hypothetical protein GMJLKIPL_6157 [Methylobacterium isbiliense]|jgi:hypothetical protein|uniref:Uncharacterized protein n=1 Tax=Methylobacterium isbiliense TaxID=315478 RepID=A0ABQ4SLU7_9HYPH|nr:hypothetical protein GMJLKIPL_6157 [Methylobacterium isbiliense]
MNAVPKVPRRPCNGLTLLLNLSEHEVLLQ